MAVRGPQRLYGNGKQTQRNGRGRGSTTSPIRRPALSSTHRCQCLSTCRWGNVNQNYNSEGPNAWMFENVNQNVNQNYNAKGLKNDSEKFRGIMRECGGQKKCHPPVLKSRTEQEFEDYRVKVLVAKLYARKEQKINPNPKYPTENFMPCIVLPHQPRK